MGKGGDYGGYGVVVVQIDSVEKLIIFFVSLCFLTFYMRIGMNDLILVTPPLATVFSRCGLYWNKYSIFKSSAETEYHEVAIVVTKSYWIPFTSLFRINYNVVKFVFFMFDQDVKLPT